jgi:NADP-reducing hydrogenase subunit HndD
VALTIDGRAAEVPEGATLLDAARTLGIDTPTLCFAHNLTPVNACRVCVVELEGARTLVPACARKAEPGMVVHTDSDRAYAPAASSCWSCWPRRSTCRPRPKLPSSWPATARARALRPARAPQRRRRARRPHARPPRAIDGASAATVHQPVKVDNDLYVRDYGKCILCYKCVEACGTDAQHTFAIAVAGRGFDARISTEHAVPLTSSACVYCGNCIGVCPTGALMPTREFVLRASGQWRPEEQTTGHHRVPVLRRGLRRDAPRAGQHHREGHLAARVLGDQRAPVYQGPLRLRVRAAARHLAQIAPPARRACGYSAPCADASHAA